MLLRLVYQDGVMLLLADVKLSGVARERLIATYQHYSYSTVLLCLQPPPLIPMWLLFP